ncbi:MAG TPA: hypothetical protein DEO88_12895 [Syntrophobacteraceae bacterium]|nr:hypothetical protein [Syntrophobacteraceae bacterium]
MGIIAAVASLLKLRTPWRLWAHHRAAAGGPPWRNNRNQLEQRLAGGEMVDSLVDGLLCLYGWSSFHFRVR